jgi:mycothiol synthase
MPSSATASSDLLDVRAYRAVDFDALYELIGAGGRFMTRTGLADHLGSPMLNAERDVFVVEQSGGAPRLVGVRDVRITGRGDEPSPIFESWGTFRAGTPTHMFDALLQAATARASEIVAERGAISGTLQTRCDIADSSTRTALEANGLRSVRELWTIVRASLEGVQEPRFPSHINVRHYRVGQDEQAWVTAFNDAFADHFGGWMGMPLAFWERYVASPTFKPHISLVAWDGVQIAGFGHFRIDDELNALRGRKQGVMRYIGVRPAWRRQGLARALTRAGLLALGEAGMDSVGSGVDGTNVTGAHLLYLDEGFQVAGRELLYRIAIGRSA